MGRDVAEARRVQILQDDAACPALPIVEGEGLARAVVWPGVGAHLRSMHRISLGPGARTVRMQHPMEAVYFIMKGRGAAVDDGTQTSSALVTGSMALIEPGTPYSFSAGDESVEIVGGPCPADPAMYVHLAED